MRKKYELVIFDVDGTLLDTSEGILGAVRYTIQTLGYPLPPRQELFSFIGPPVQDTLTKIYGLQGDALWDAATLFRDRYGGEDLLKAVPYEGIYQVLETLNDRGIQVAIATYKREDYALKLLRHFGFDRYTDIMYGADFQGKLKKKDIIEKCIRESGAPDRSKILMVGDTAHDAQGAMQAGTAFLGVTFGFGFRTKEDVARYSSVGAAETPLQILDFVEGDGPERGSIA